MRSTFALLLFVLGSCLPSVMSAQYLGYFAPKSNTQLYAYVDDGNGNAIPYADLQLYNGFLANSNGHTHIKVNPEPFSSITPNDGGADGSGQMLFTLGTTLVGQQEYIDVCSSLAPTCTSYWLIVGYSDLYLLNNPTIWYLNGAKPEHGNSTYFNHWTTVDINSLLYYATIAYLSSHAQCIICVNDSTLPYGGKFDIKQTWASPHIQHDRGSAVDLSTLTSQCPPAYVIRDPHRMVQNCYDNGAFWAKYETVGVPPHVHCNSQNTATYPH